jgi:hypothetical protein
MSCWGLRYIPYVAAFVPDHSGEHFVPHVTVGIGTIDFWNAMLAGPFEPFTFSPVGAVESSLWRVDSNFQRPVTHCAGTNGALAE